MAEDHDGAKNPEHSEEKDTTQYLKFTLDRATGQVGIETNIEDVIQRYGIWMMGQEVMFREQTMTALAREAQRQRIITPDQHVARGPGIVQ
jgi:hypothetical protein